jgi:hypothetical protein
MKLRVLAVIAALLCSSAAHAQSACQYIAYGSVLTAGQWNGCFTAKQDYLGSAPLLLSGGTMTGELVTAPSATNSAGFNLPPGVAPTSPNNGDMWAEIGGLFVQINGSTIELIGAGSGSFTATAPMAVTFPSAGMVNYALSFNSSLIDSAGSLGINLAHQNIFTVGQAINLTGGSLGTALTGTLLQMANANGVATRYQADAYGAAAYFSAVAYGGSFASPATLTSGTEMGGFNAWGYNGSAVGGPAGAFRIYANGTWSLSSYPTYADVAVTATGQSSEIEVAKWQASGPTAVSQTIGTPGSIAGSLIFGNVTSGSITVQPPTGALGTVTNTLQAASDIFVYRATTDTLTNKTLAATSDVLGGVTMTLGSDATGDIYYRNSSGILTRLGIGSTNNVLNVSGGLPAWTANPTLTTLIVPTVYGGTATNTNLLLQSTNNGSPSGDQITLEASAFQHKTIGGTNILDYGVTVSTALTVAVATNFTTDVVVTGTTAPTFAAGTIAMIGNGSPSLGANGEGAIYLPSTTGGIAIRGKGSVSDVQIQNATGGVACNVATGTTTLSCVELQVSGGTITAGANGGTGGALTLFGATSGSATVQASATGALILTGVASSTSALDYMCINSGTGVVTYDSSGTCLVSALRTKKEIAPLRDSLAVVTAIDAISFEYKDQGVIKGRQEGVSADSMAIADPLLVEYDADGLPLKPKLMGLIGRMVGAVQELKADNDNLRREVARLVASRR